MKVLAFKGYKGFCAYQVFHRLMFGIKQLPIHMTKTYEEFYAELDAMPESEQAKIVRHAALFVDINKDEVAHLVCHCADANGIGYQEANLGNLSPEQTIDAIVAVCMELSKIRIGFLTENEKKN